MNLPNSPDEIGIDYLEAGLEDYLNNRNCKVML